MTDVIPASTGLSPLATPTECGLPTLSPTMIEDHLASAQRVEANWKATIRKAILDEKTEQLFRTRDEYEASVRSWVRQIDEFVAFLIAAFGPRYSDDSIGVLGKAQQTKRSLNEFSRRIFSRWGTLDEFEFLLAEETALSATEFDAVANRVAPAFAEWLDRDEPRPW
jgi:hypothetical protein